jgi:hypothetical protein
MVITISIVNKCTIQTTHRKLPKQLKNPITIPKIPKNKTSLSIATVQQLKKPTTTKKTIKHP